MIPKPQQYDYPAYGKWIADRLSTTSADPHGNCAAWTAYMLRAFPELTRVRGHVLLANGLVRSHWWLVTGDGTTVDPTESQFTSPYFGRTHILEYTSIDPNTHIEPTGKCPNCGDLIYDGRDMCSEPCFNEYINSVNGA